MAFPAPADGGKISRDDYDLVDVLPEPPRSALRGEQAVPERGVVDDVDARMLTVAGARRGRGERDGGLNGLAGDRPGEVPHDMPRCRELGERRVLRGEECGARDVRLDGGRGICMRRKKRVKARHWLWPVAMQFAVGPQDADGMGDL